MPKTHTKPTGKTTGTLPQAASPVKQAPGKAVKVPKDPDARKRAKNATTGRKRPRGATLKQLTEVRAALGDIPVRRPHWRDLANCILIDLTITLWTPKKRTSLEDLGLDAAPVAFQAFADEQLNLGFKLLMPAERWAEFEAIKGRARQDLAKLSFASPWGDGRLVPLKNYRKAKQLLTDLQARFNQLADDTSKTRRKWVPKVREGFRNLALVQLATRNGKLVALADSSPEDAAEVERYLDAITDQIPAAQAIREKFTFVWTRAEVKGQESLILGVSLEELRAEKAQLEGAIQALDLKAHTAKLTREEAAQMAQMELALEVKRDVEESAASDRKTKVENLLTDVAATVRQLLQKTASSVRDAIQGTGKVDKTRLNQLRNVVDKVKNLNFHDDPEIEALAAQVRDLAERNQDTEAVDILALTRALDDVDVIVRADLLALGVYNRLDLEDVPNLDDLSLDRLTDARTRLSLEPLHEYAPARPPDDLAFSREA